MSQFIVNGIAIKNPTTFKIDRFNVTDMERLCSAKMMGTLIAKKLKFFFTYEAISAQELNTILEATWNTPNIFYPLQYVENGASKIIEVYSGSIPSELHRAGAADNWVWKHVQFNLIEQ